MEQFKSFIARRRWKVQMKCESRSVRTVTTKYVDSEGNVKSKKRAELTGKSVLYEGEYSETDSEAETEFKKNDVGGVSTSSGSVVRDKISSVKEAKIKNLGTFVSTDAVMSNLGAISTGMDSIKLQGGNAGINQPDHHKLQSDSSDASMFRRQKLVDNIPNIELKPVKVTEFSESIGENSEDDEAAGLAGSGNDNQSRSSAASSFTTNSNSNKLSHAEMEAKISNHLSFNNQKADGGVDKKNIIKDETKEDEKSDIKIIDSTDEKTGLAIRTSIENKMKTNENIKVCKGDETVDVKETDDAIIKKITTKTKTTKSVVKTTTTKTTKKGT